MGKLVFPEGVFAEVIKNSKNAVKELVNNIPTGVAELLKSKRLVNAYTDMRDEIAAHCHKKTTASNSSDHWDSRKIDAIVGKYKAVFHRRGVQIHFNQYSFWFKKQKQPPILFGRHS